MTVWLGRQETVARFRAYLYYVITLDPNSHATPLDDETQLELKDNEMEEPAPTYPLPHSTHSVAIKPAFPHTDFNTLTTQFKANNFIQALSTYICRLIPPSALPVLPNLMDRFNLYKCITILQPSNADAGFPMSVECVHATPSVPAKGGSKAVPAHFDIVLVCAADANENQHTKGTYLEGVLLIDLLASFQSSNRNKFNRTSCRPD